MRTSNWLACGTGLLLALHCAWAAEPDDGSLPSHAVLSEPARPQKLQHLLPADVAATASFATLWLVSEFAVKQYLVPPSCRWCAVNGLDQAGRGIRSLTPEGRKGADIASGVFAYVAVPVAALGLDYLLTWQNGGTWREGALDTLFILEAVMLSQVVNQAVKLVAARERPFVAALPQEEKPLTADPKDNNLSFYSGHAAFSFSLVASAATVAKLRGYRYWWVIAAAGAPLAFTASLLRMVADKHYFTDVLTGAGIGTLIGIGVPALLHRPIEVGPAKVSVAPIGMGVSLVAAF